MIEALSAMLTGAGSRGEILSWVLHDPSQPTLHGAAFLAIDIGTMVPIDRFKQRVDDMIRDIRQAPKAKGSARIYLPGEMEWQKRRNAMVEGIPLPKEVLESLRGLAEEVGMTVQID
jgi:LDH2 family malate/lactate/ureidoglycolate dehydrogenase